MAKSKFKPVQDEQAPPGMMTDGEGNYRFAPGNELWKIAFYNGVNKRKYKTVEELLVKICGYFNWLHENPMYESKLVSYQGANEIVEVPKMRAPTLKAMQLYIGVDGVSWQRMRNGQTVIDFTTLCSFAEDLLYQMKFEGAASNLLNPMIIARDLGLSEKTELSGHDGGPIQTQTIDPKLLDTRTLKNLMAARIAMDESKEQDDAPTD